MGFFKKDKKTVYAEGVTDIHCHILPGVDDGAKNMDQSKDMLDIAYEEGIRIMIATPHHMPEDEDNASPEVIQEKVAQLQAYADEQGYDMTILPGNEVYFYSEAPELLEEGKINTMAGTDYVLVEFSPMDEGRYIRNSLAELQNMGYEPIIAHVERYDSLCKDLDRITELRDMGILIQVNVASIMGDFGKPMKAVAEKLLKKQMVDFIGTDAHSSGRRAPRVKECAEYLYKKYPAAYVDKILHANAEKYIISRMQ